MRERYRMLRAAGLCTSCKQPSELARCQPCRDRVREAQKRAWRNYRARRRALAMLQGVCQYCCKLPRWEDRMGCKPCVQKITARTNAAYSTRRKRRNRCRLCRKEGHNMRNCKSPLAAEGLTVVDFVRRDHSWFEERLKGD